MNSTENTMGYSGEYNVSSQNVFGIGAIKYNFAETDPFCKFFEIEVS